MKTYTLTSRLSVGERETHFWIDGANDDMVVMDTTIPKDFNKAKKQGWTQIAEYLYSDGSVCGGCFEAPRRCISIRGMSKRVMTEEQLENLAKARKVREENK